MFLSGTKRAASSDFTNGSDSSNKRAMEGTSYDAHHAETSYQPVTVKATFNMNRAELARQHVRALNSQFASWVQKQLEHHQDEFWEDGVRDYLSHASKVMERFKDVVSWIKANSVNSGPVSTSHALGDPSTEKGNVTLSSDSKSGFVNSFLPVSSSNSLTAGPQNVSSSLSGQMPVFSGSLSDQKLVDDSKSTAHLSVNNGFSGVPMPKFVTFSNMQSSQSQSATPFSFSHMQVNPGKQSAEEPADTLDEDAEQEQPSSPSVKKTEEKGVAVVYESKCKVYLKPDNPVDKGWKDIGVGSLSIKCKEGAVKASKESKPVIVIRNDVGKILLNASIYRGIKTSIQKNTVASIFHTSDGSSEDGGGAVITRTYLLRVKNEEEAAKLAAAINENAPQD